uniref:Uncharacterized protein n=1 Tax=Trichogramma kaykai TaxID=54128 RepID=A0ABD2XD91_9HYME
MTTTTTNRGRGREPSGAPPIGRAASFSRRASGTEERRVCRASPTTTADTPRAHRERLMACGIYLYHIYSSYPSTRSQMPSGSC